MKMFLLWSEKRKYKNYFDPTNQNKKIGILNQIKECIIYDNLFFYVLFYAPINKIILFRRFSTLSFKLTDADIWKRWTWILTYFGAHPFIQLKYD